MERRYRLLKDLPDYKAGEVFVWNGCFYEAQSEPEFGGRGQWPAFYVETKTEWFSEIKEELKERKVVLHCVNDIVDSVEVDGEMFVNAKSQSLPEEKEVTKFYDMSNIPSPSTNTKVSFCTQDEKFVNGGDKVWLLSTTNWCMSETTMPSNCNPFTGVTGNEFKYFSTQEAATNYIIENKPCLSLKDVMALDMDIRVRVKDFTTKVPVGKNKEVIIFTPDQLKNLAASKIKSP